MPDWMQYTKETIPKVRGTKTRYNGILIVTGWFKHKKPKSLQSSMPTRRFWEIDPEILHTCLICPCQACYEWGFRFFVFFRQIFGFFFFFLDIWVLRGPTFPAKKPKTKKPIRKRLGRGTLNTWAKSQGLSQKWRGVLGFCAVKCKITAGHRYNLFLVYIRFWALNWLNISPTQSVLGIVARKFFQTCLGASGSGWSRKNTSFFSSCSKCLYFFFFFLQ